MVSTSLSPSRNVRLGIVDGDSLCARRSMAFLGSPRMTNLMSLWRRVCSGLVVMLGFDIINWVLGSLVFRMFMRRKSSNRLFYVDGIRMKLGAWFFRWEVMLLWFSLRTFVATRSILMLFSCSSVVVKVSFRGG